jgi:5-(carboxyamino)imidazole ribonucleotide synthase
MTATASPSKLPTGSTVGILGGGQLGRMLAMEAARLGMRCHVYAPDAGGPAAQVCAAASVGAYDDEAALAAFADSVDVITYEFENVDGAAARFLDQRKPVRPSAEALLVCQDRIDEKRFLRRAGAQTAEFAAVDTLDGLRAALADIKAPAILKTRRFGYDGKGQILINDAAEAEKAWHTVGEAPCILEALVRFDYELSIIVARSLNGDVASYDPARNIHENHILSRSIVPADIPDDIATAARELAGRIVTRLDYVGVMGVELFYSGDGEPSLFVNELAPRVHNSGHWTLDACAISQFEQHIRAICGWPLGTTSRHSDAVMQNLLDDDIDASDELSRLPDSALHLYGKGKASPGRKMGHLTRLYPFGRRPDGNV